MIVSWCTKKDPYAKKNTSQTHKLPIRSIINETAQNTDKKVLEIPLDRIYRSREIQGGDAGKLGVFNYYDDIFKGNDENIKRVRFAFW